MPLSSAVAHLAAARGGAHNRSQAAAHGGQAAAGGSGRSGGRVARTSRHAWRMPPSARREPPSRQGRRRVTRSARVMQRARLAGRGPRVPESPPLPAAPRNLRIAPGIRTSSIREPAYGAVLQDRRGRTTPRAAAENVTPLRRSGSD